MAGDVNGDGKDDIVAFHPDGVYVAFSVSRGEFSIPVKTQVTTFTVNNGGWISHNIHPRFMSDVDGDGKKI